MGYELVNAIEECINNCRDSKEKACIQRFDETNNCTLWLEAEWVLLSDDNQDIYVVELYFCYCDTGRIAYTQRIYETIEVR